MKAAVQAVNAEGATTTAVGVVHSNAEALRWYEREGFEPFYVTLLRR
jgi:ribosomal protein S18 acetylase RimI-like enzyme